MRKRIIIGVFGIIVVTVLVFELSRPKKGTVEWHKREYLAAVEGLRGETWSDRCHRVYANITGKAQRDHSGATPRRKQLGDTFDSNRTALIRLGYLEQCRVVLSNLTISQAVDAFESEKYDDRFVRIDIEWTNGNPAVIITAPKTEVHNRSNLVKRADERGP